jgi:hypothetical protein
MTTFKIIFSSLFLTALMSCGKNEPEKEIVKEEHLSEIPKITTKTIEDTINNIETDSGLAAALENQNQTSNTTKSNIPQSNNLDQKSEKIITEPVKKEAEIIINTPLRNLLNNGQAGKSYTKKELIEQYKFPKEAVDLIKQVTYVGPNKLYFKWGSTWLVEKVSDAKFENDTMIFIFKKNKTYVSGGAIGIKYNKKIYTELILNNGSAYIPTVKGYHWEINK